MSEQNKQERLSMPRFILTRANYLTVTHFECKPLALALPENIGPACTS